MYLPAGNTHLVGSMPPETTRARSIRSKGQKREGDELMITATSQLIVFLSYIVWTASQCFLSEWMCSASSV